MRRTYVETSAWRAPFNEVPFAGLGALHDAPGYPSKWPRGRSYWDVARFRSPYISNPLMFQDNSLMGITDYLKQQATGVIVGSAAVGAVAGLALGYLLWGRR